MSSEVLRHQFFVRYPLYNNSERIRHYANGRDYVRVTWHFQWKDHIGELLQHSKISMSRCGEDTQYWMRTSPPTSMIRTSLPRQKPLEPLYVGRAVSTAAVASNSPNTICEDGKVLRSAQIACNLFKHSRARSSFVGIVSRAYRDLPRNRRKVDGTARTSSRKSKSRVSSGSSREVKYRSSSSN